MTSASHVADDALEICDVPRPQYTSSRTHHSSYRALRSAATLLPLSCRVYVGRRDITDHLEFRHFDRRRVGHAPHRLPVGTMWQNECDGTVTLLRCMITMRLSVRNSTLYACFIQFIQDVQKTWHIASRQTFHRDTGQTAEKRDVPAKTGRVATLSALLLPK